MQNGAEAVDPHTGRVEVSASESGGELTLVITDNGRGMTEQIQAHIFEPLYTTKLRGTGLGLAIVDGIIKRHEGRIVVASVLGRGTAFRSRFQSGDRRLSPRRIWGAPRICAPNPAEARGNSANGQPRSADRRARKAGKCMPLGNSMSAVWRKRSATLLALMATTLAFGKWRRTSGTRSQP